MKIYLAGGFSITNVKGRETKLSKKMPSWKRLFSYYWMEYFELYEILNIKKEYENQQSGIAKSTGNSKTRAVE